MGSVVAIAGKMRDKTDPRVWRSVEDVARTEDGRSYYKDSNLVVVEGYDYNWRDGVFSEIKVQIDNPRVWNKSGNM